MTGAHAVVSAASTRPNLPAPNSAAHRAAMTTTAPPASAGMIRTAVGLTPSTLVTILVSSGASGGWSTYPKARCRPASMKYSSSCMKPYLPLTASSSATRAAAISQAGSGTPSADAVGRSPGGCAPTRTSASLMPGRSMAPLRGWGTLPEVGTALRPGREGRQLSQPGDQTYGVVMARQVKPSRSRIGRLIGEASTCRYR